MLGHRVIHGHHREFQHPVGSHRAQADHASGGFFCSGDHTRQQVAAFAMKRAHQIGPIVHGHLGFMVQGRTEVFVISLVILALDGKNGDFILGNQSRCHVILGGKRVGSR